MLPLSLVGVHTEVFRTEHLRLPSGRVRGILRRVLVPEKQVFCPCEMKSSNPFILLSLMLRRALLWTSRLGVGEPIVPRRIWVPLMEFSEFFQIAY